MSTEDAYGVELDRRLNAERALTAVIEVVEAYESCGPKQQSTRDVLAAVRAAFECAVLHGLDNCSQAPARALREAAQFFENDGDYRAAFYRVMERCEELKTSVAEHQWNALEMARKADQAERRAEEAEFHVEQLRDARDRAERQAEDAEAAIEATRDLLDGWEQDGPDDYAVRLLIQRVRETLALGERFRAGREGERESEPLPIHRTEAGYPSCSTCDGGGCYDCTDPA